MTRRIVVLSLSIFCCWTVLGLPAQAGAGCHEAPRPFDARVLVVALEEWCFSPAVVRVEPKQSVTWVNRDFDDHTVTGVGATWGGYDALGYGDRLTHSWAAPGVYPYSCVLHPGMVGVVVVGDGVPGSGGAPRENHEVSPGNVALSNEQPAAGADSNHADDASAGARTGSLVSWLWAAPLVIAAGLLGGRRVARRRATSM